MYLPEHRTREENMLQIKREEYHKKKASEETGDEDKLQHSRSGRFICEYKFSCNPTGDGIICGSRRTPIAYSKASNFTGWKNWRNIRELFGVGGLALSFAFLTGYGLCLCRRTSQFGQYKNTFHRAQFSPVWHKREWRRIRELRTKIIKQIKKKSRNEIWKKIEENTVIIK